MDCRFVKKRWGVFENTQSVAAGFRLRWWTDELPPDLSAEGLLHDTFSNVSAGASSSKWSLAYLSNTPLPS